MNRQGPTGIEYVHYTWNAVGGCFHRCEWQMPDNSIAVCYAKSVAEGLAQQHYPQGFEAHYFRPDKLDEPLRVKKPARIFLDSMADLMGHWVPDDHIRAVLDTVRKADWHDFLLLTKNAPRLLQFAAEFPPNLWVGVSLPPTFFMGKQLSHDQQVRMFSKSLDVLAEVGQHVPVTWMSFEPLSWDVAEELWRRPTILKWAVIGAATNGAQAYQPEKRWVQRLLSALNTQHCPVFFKGNLQWSSWREEFPARAVTQLSMF